MAGPFKIGDRIQIQDHQGDVIDIGVFKFTLLEIGNWVDANRNWPNDSNTKCGCFQSTHCELFQRV